MCVFSKKISLLAFGFLFFFTFDLEAAVLSPELEKAFAAGPLQRVIVSLKDEFYSPVKSEKKLTYKERVARRKQMRAAYKKEKDELKAAMKSKGEELKIIHEYSILPMMALNVTRAQALLLLDNPLVEQIEADKKAAPAISEAADFVGVADYQQYTHGGAGTAIAILDTPVQYWNKDYFPGCFEKGKFVPDSTSTKCPIKKWINVVDGTDVEELAAKSDHGSIVAATVNAIAPEAQIIAINVFHWDSTAGKTGAPMSYNSDQIAGLNYVLDNLEAGHDLAAYNIMAVNMSLSGKRTDNPSTPCNGIATKKPIWNLYNDDYYVEGQMIFPGIATFIAAGNDGLANSVGEPSCVSAAFTVGAQFYRSGGDTYSCTLENGTNYKQHGEPGDIACFSNRNGLVDIVAPGVNILYAKGTDSEGAHSGTSFASPLAAASYLLYQAAYHEERGIYDDIIWAEQLFKTMSQPIYSFGSYYSQFNLKNELTPHWSAGFPLSPRYAVGIDEDTAEESRNRIYKDRTLVRTVTITEANADQLMLSSKVGGMYLSVDLVVPHLKNITISITSPDGTFVRFPLPDTTTANFNGIIGRTILPGALQSFNGKKVHGTWNIEFHNNSDEVAYLMMASLLFVNDGCQPACDMFSCGDNLCGGICGVSSCDDDVYCNGAEHCRYGSCHSGNISEVDPNCEDGDELPCTSYCNEGLRKCDVAGGKKTLKGYCLIDNTCYKEGERKPDNACQSCQSTISQTTFIVDKYATTCENGDLCTMDDYCNTGVCMPGVSRDCDDDNICTEDSCDSKLGCVHINLDTTCDDGNACTLGERCIDGKCSGGDRIFCDDNNICTNDSCDPESGKCLFVNNELPCDDGNAETVGDKCYKGACVPGKKKSGCSCRGGDDPSAIFGAFTVLFLLALFMRRKGEISAK